MCWIARIWICLCQGQKAWGLYYLPFVPSHSTPAFPIDKSCLGIIHMRIWANHSRCRSVFLWVPFPIAGFFLDVTVSERLEVLRMVSRLIHDSCRRSYCSSAGDRHMLLQLDNLSRMESEDMRLVKLQDLGARRSQVAICASIVSPTVPS